jgi:hypothetical protein
MGKLSTAPAFHIYEVVAGGAAEEVEDGAPWRGMRGEAKTVEAARSMRDEIRAAIVSTISDSSTSHELKP